MDKEFLENHENGIANLRNFIICIGPISSIFDIITYVVMYVFANTPSEQSLFQSGWFVVGLLTQTLIVHMIRTQKIPFIQSTASTPSRFINRSYYGNRDLYSILTTWCACWFTSIAT